MCGRYGRRGDKQRIAEWMQTHNTNVFDVLRAKLQLPLTWINESEHVDFVDLRFITLNIAIERLRIEFLPKSTMNYIHADLRQLLDGELASEILTADETKTGVLSDEQKRAPVSKLRSANTPSALFLLDELCLGLGVNGLEKDMGILRNRLTHSASYGNFDFSKVIDLQYKLSHVLDVCILKILGYEATTATRTPRGGMSAYPSSRRLSTNLQKIQMHRVRIKLKGLLSNPSL